MEVLEWVVLSECECVRRGCSAAVCDVLCSVVVTAVSDTRHHLSPCSTMTSTCPNSLQQM